MAVVGKYRVIGCRSARQLVTAPTRCLRARCSSCRPRCCKNCARAPDAYTYRSLGPARRYTASVRLLIMVAAHYKRTSTDGSIVYFNLLVGCKELLRFQKDRYCQECRARNLAEWIFRIQIKYLYMYWYTKLKQLLYFVLFGPVSCNAVSCRTAYTCSSHITVLKYNRNINETGA